MSAVTWLDALLDRLAAGRIEHEPIETYSNGVRHVTSIGRNWASPKITRGTRTSASTGV